MKTYTVKQTLSTSDSIDRIVEIIESNHSFSRADLARTVCDDFNLKDARGRPKQSSCLVTLRELEKKGLIKLPIPRKTFTKKWEHKRLGHDVSLPENVPESVDNLRLIVVESKNRPLKLSV